MEEMHTAQRAHTLSLEGHILSLDSNACMHAYMRADRSCDILSLGARAHPLSRHTDAQLPLSLSLDSLSTPLSARLRLSLSRFSL